MTNTDPRSMTGLDYLTAMRDGTIPNPPIGVTLGFTLTEVEAGRVQFDYTASENVFNPLGTVHGGLLCTLLDAAVGCAAHSTLASGVGYTTLELTTHYLRPAMGGQRLRTIGRVTKGGRRVIFASGEVLDDNDQLVATAGSTLLVMQ